MKRLSAIILTIVLVAAFALALTACNPVEKTETFNATKSDLEAICKDKAAAHAHYQVTKTVGGVNSSFELYLITFSQLSESYLPIDGYAVYAIEHNADGTVRYRLANGKDSDNAIYCDALVNADGTTAYSFAVDAGNYFVYKQDYIDAYGLESLPAASSVHDNYKSDIAAAKSALTNALNNGDFTITAERQIKGKDVVAKTYTVSFDLGDGSSKSKGTVTVRTDGSDTVTEVSVAWENGDSCSTKYIYDGTGEVGYENILNTDQDNLSAFFEICGVPEKNLAMM